MLRVILDTNIYGNLIEEKSIRKIEEKIIKDKKFIVYNYHLIRKELRNIPKTTKASRKTRILLLNLYDEITRKHFLEHSLKILELAKDFYKYYRLFGGIKNWEKSNIDIDFMLVACAILNKLDIVVSDDVRTLLSNAAKKAYKEVSIKEGLWIPNFWLYSDLKKRFNF